MSEHSIVPNCPTCGLVSPVVMLDGEWWCEKCSEFFVDPQDGKVVEIPEDVF